MNLIHVKTRRNAGIAIEISYASEEAYINPNLIESIIPFDEKYSLVSFMGGTALDVSLPARDLVKLVNDTDPYSSGQDLQTDYTRFPTIEIGASKFRVDIVETVFKDGVSVSLKLICNFPVKNDILRSIIIETPGVESYNDSYSPWKYEISISIGKMFVASEIRRNVESKVKEFLSSEI